MIKIILLTFAVIAMFCGFGNGNKDDQRNWLLWALCWFAAASFI